MKNHIQNIKTIRLETIYFNLFQTHKIKYIFVYILKYDIP